MGASGHAEEEMERVVLAVLGEEGDEGGVGDDVGGREGEEEAEGVGEEVEFEVSGDEGVGEMGVFFVAFEERGVDGLGQVGVAGAGGHVEGVEEGVGLRGKVVGAMAEFVAEREGGRWFGVWRRKGNRSVRFDECVVYILFHFINK